MPFKDRTGQVFGRLTVIEFSRKNDRRQAFWKCQCECGSKIEAFGGNLHSGATRSCGCLRDEGNNLKHGNAKNHQQTVEYVCWMSMKDRIRNPNNKRFKNYGGRGISICTQWYDFAVFLKDMGPKPTPRHSIERSDTDGSYEPSNCYWGTRSEQARNKTNSATIEYDGRIMCIADWADEFKIPFPTLWARLKVLRWDTKRALISPVRKKTR